MFGILNINKPAGVTSRDVVNQVQRLVRPAKAGHAGTLDPLATGVLVVCVGPATRLIEYVQRMSKAYRGVFLLGRRSDTDDIEGQVVELPDAPRPTRAEITAALPAFTGVIQQRPPAYSAVKVAGKRAYKLARQGETVELSARPVTVESIVLVDYDYPKLTLDIRCGSGTYIRSIGRDLGQRLGTAAVMAELERTAIGRFTTADACRTEELNGTSLLEHLRPPVEAVADLPRIVINASQQQQFRHGRMIEATGAALADEYAAVDPQGNLLAILARRDDGRLHPVRNFLSAT